jgi:hypothetical protein
MSAKKTHGRVDLLATLASPARADDRHPQSALGFWEARSRFEQATGTGD